MHLGDVILAKGVSLTVQNSDAYTGLTVTGEGDAPAVVRQTHPKDDATVTTTPSCEMILDASSLEAPVSGVSVNPQGGTVRFKGAYTDLSLESASGVQTSFIFPESASVDSTHIVNLGTSTLTIDTEGSLVFQKFKTGVNGGNSVVNHTKGVLTLTSTTIGGEYGGGFGNNAAICLGSGSTPTTYNLRGGRLETTGGMTLGRDGSVTVNVSGGTLSLYNIWGRGSAASALNISGGRVEIGAGGISGGSSGWTDGSSIINNFTFSQSGGVLLAKASNTMAQPISLSGTPTFAAAAGATMTVTRAVTGDADTVLTLGEEANTGDVVLNNLTGYAGTIKPLAGVTVQVKGDGVTSASTIDLSAEGSRLDLVLASEASPATLKLTGLADDRSNLTVTIAGGTEAISPRITENDDGSLTIATPLPVLRATNGCVFETESSWTGGTLPANGDIIIDASAADAEEVIITVNASHDAYEKIYLRGAGKKIGFTGAGAGFAATTVLHVESGTTLLVDGASATTAEPLVHDMEIEGPGGVCLRGAVALSKAGTYTGGTTIEADAVVSVSAANCLGTSAVDGSGTISATGCIPAASVAASWTGVVSVRFINADERDLNNLAALVNGNSHLLVENVIGYFTGTKNLANLEVIGEGFGLSNGSSSSLATLKIGNLTGSGKIKWTKGGGNNLAWKYQIEIADISGFTGKIEKRATTDNRDNGTAIVIGTPVTTPVNKKILFCGTVAPQPGTVFEAEDGIVVDGTMTIADGQVTFVGGLSGSGTVKLAAGASLAVTGTTADADLTFVTEEKGCFVRKKLTGETTVYSLQSRGFKIVVK